MFQTISVTPSNVELVSSETGSLGVSLPRKPACHFADEPAHALLRRTIDLYEPYIDARSTFRDFGWEGARTSASSCRRIAKACGQDPDMILACTPHMPDGVKDGPVWIGAEPLPAKAVRIAKRAWCAACLLETGYHRVAWDIRAFEACPAHRTRLRSQCACGQEVTWHRGTMTACRCGQDLSRLDDETASDAEVMLSLYIQGRLNCDLRVSHPLLDGLALAEVLRIVCGMARLIARVREPGRKFNQVWETGFAELGFEPFLHGSQAFHRYLDDAYSQSIKTPSDRRWGLQKAYGPHLRPFMLSLPAGHPSAITFHDMLMEHASTRVTLTKLSLDGRGKRLAPDRIGLNGASRRLGVSYVGVLKLAQHLRLVAQRTGKGQPAHILRAHIPIMKAAIKGSINLPEVGRRLGTSTEVAKTLLAAGIITPLTEGSPGWIPLHARELQFAAAMPSELVTKLARCVTRSDESDLQPLPQAYTIRLSIATVIELALSGEIEFAGIDRKAVGLNRFLISFSKLRKWTLSTGSDRLCIRDAARELGVHYDAMTAIARTGLVSYETEHRIIYVPRTELERFKHKYVGPTEIGNLFTPARDARGISRLLSQRGVVPLFGPPAYRTSLYDREVVLRAVEVLKAEQSLQATT